MLNRSHLAYVPSFFPQMSTADHDVPIPFLAGIAKVLECLGISWSTLSDLRCDTAIGDDGRQAIDKLLQHRGHHPHVVGVCDREYCQKLWNDAISFLHRCHMFLHMFILLSLCA